MLSIQKWIRTWSRRLAPPILALGLTTGGVVVASTPAWAASCGDTLLAAGSWLGGGGVNVYSNAQGGQSWGYNNCGGTDDYVNGADAGGEWQCVELVNRLYLTKGWTTAHWFGNGNTLKDNLPNSSKFSSQANGHITTIVPGDVVTLDDGGYGHAGVVNTVLKTVTYDPAAKTLGSELSGYSTQGVIHTSDNTASGIGTSSSSPSGTPTHADLAWFANANHLYTFTGPAMGTTGDASPYTTPTWAGVGDYDHNGKDDLFLYDGPTSTIYWASSDGSGVGTHGMGAIRGPGVGAPDWAAVGDFTGDGFKDSLVWFQGNTLYTFSGKCLCTTGTVTGFHAPTWGAVGNYDHGTRDGLFLYDAATTTIYWMSSNGSAVGANGIQAIRGPGVGAPSWAGVGDFTGDGYNDSIAWFANTNHLYTFSGSNLGTTGDAAGYTTPTWAGVGHYNGDKKSDLILYDGPTSTIYWASSDGSGVGTHGMGAIRGPGVGAPSWAGVGDFEGG